MKQINTKFILKLNTRRFWQVAVLEKYVNGNLVETININRHYSLDENWFYIYESIGGSGTGHRPGEIIQKVYIGDAEFERQTN